MKLMKPNWKWIGIGAGVAVGAAVLAAALFVAFFPKEFAARQAERRIEEATGRDLTLGEHIELSFWPALGFSVDNASLSNPEGFTGAAAQQAAEASQQRIEAARADAEALLGREIARLDALARVNPAVHPEEVQALRDELDALRVALPGARPRLDALRLIASPDFLNLRG